MRYFGWILHEVTPEERATILPQIAALLCEHFNLCASVGCGCVVGAGEVVCREADFPDPHHAHHISQGPTWHATVTGLPQSVRIDLYYSGPLISSEHAAFSRALHQFNRPLFTIQGSGSGSY